MYLDTWSSAEDTVLEDDGTSRSLTGGSESLRAGLGVLLVCLHFLSILCFLVAGVRWSDVLLLPWLPWHD